MDKGARYYKCDFQVHTPRDIQFSGHEYVTDLDRKEYSEKFIKACRNMSLDAVAITDHHDLYFYNYIKNASIDERDSDGNLINEEKRIVIFPGMELTLDVPCQSLLIFDANLNLTDELIIKIYTALKIPEHSSKSESKTSETVRLPFKSNNDIYDAVNNIEELRGRFIVFPNVKDGGSSSIIRQGFHNEYAKGIFVGGYLDRGLYDSHKTKEGWNNVIDGKVDAYGYRSLGIFQTSDNRTDSFTDLGTSATWVKWSTPTAEGLRQACLARKSRILQEQPVLPVTRITNIKIIRSSFLKDLEVELNPQFNVCIGGRGTGKSSLLQYISWVLGKDSNSEKKDDLESFIKNTLDKDGSVELTIIKTGIQHKIKRTLSSYEIKIGSDNWQTTNGENINSIIRTDSFAQKELSKHEKNKTAQLTRIIENSVSSSVESIKRLLNENSNKIKETTVSYETFLYNLKSVEDLKAQIESIEEQIKALNDQLSSVPATDQSIIKNNSLIANEKNLIKASDYQISGLTDQIDSILENSNLSELSFDNDKIKNSSQIKELVDNHNKTISLLRETLTLAIEVLKADELKGIKRELNKLHVQHDLEYSEAKERQNKFEQIIHDLEQLREKLELLKEDRDRIYEKIKTEKGTKRKLQKLFFQRNQLNIQLYNKINSAVSDIVGKSEGSIEIELTELDKINDILDSFIEKVTGSKGQLQRTKPLFDLFSKGGQTYKQLLKFWYSIYKAKMDSENLEDILNNYGIQNETLLETDFERIMESLDSAMILDFALKLPSYNLKLLYCKDTNNKIPFEDASYGQQAGSILTILLNQEFGPLIIDQPEDDLDNKVIHRITENIVSAKHKRQLIFSSHNANIAVNGDAELILAFDHNSDKSAGEIVEYGSIDNENIKMHVKNIMEGGVKAFELRKTKYGF